MSLRARKHVVAMVASAVPIVGAIATKAFVDFQNGSLVTTEYSIKSKHVPKSMDGFRIVEIADLHDATFGFQNERLVQAVRDAKPDLIVIAGDLIHKETIGNAMTFIRHATSIAPIVFSPGNHESYSPLYPELREQLVQSGVILLEDDIATERELGISRPAGGGLIDIPSITVIGMADPLFSPWMDRSDPEKLADRKLNELMPKAQAKEEAIADRGGCRPFRILVSHRPEHFASYAREGIDLVLSGHAHGGQWRLPGLGGLYAPSQGILPKYASGMHEEGNTKMVVSRGLGNSGFPLRLNNRPEVVVITLCSDGKAPSPIDFRNRMGISIATETVALKVHDGIKGAIAGVPHGDGSAAPADKGRKGKTGKPKSATKEFLKSAAKDAAIQEAPHVMQEIIGALTPLVVSALVGKTFLAGKTK